MVRRPSLKWNFHSGAMVRLCSGDLASQQKQGRTSMHYLLTHAMMGRQKKIQKSIQTEIQKDD
jgi:hypothetical protein